MNDGRFLKGWNPKERYNIYKKMRAINDILLVFIIGTLSKNIGEYNFLQHLIKFLAFLKV